MKFKRAVGTAIAVVGFAATLLASAAPASAAVNPWTVSNTGATAKFWAEGDVFRLYDTSCDGKGVNLYWEMANGDAGNKHFGGGCGENAKYDDKNLVDDKAITICVWRDGDSSVCGRTST